MADLPEEAVEALAGELMLFRFGGKLVESGYLIRWQHASIYRAEDAPKGLALRWDQARENARRILDLDRLGIRKQRDEELRELAAGFREKAQAAFDCLDSGHGQAWGEAAAALDSIFEEADDVG